MTSESNALTRPAGATLRIIRYIAPAGDADDVVMRFADPSARHAVVVTQALEAPPEPATPTSGDAIDLLTVPIAPKDDPSIRTPWVRWIAESPLTDVAATAIVRMHGIEVHWRPGRAVIFAPAENFEALVLAVIEFAYFEGELRKLEREVADGWVYLDADKRLAYEVSTSDLEHSESVGRRMDETFQRRIRHARIEPHLYRPGAQLPATARKLGEALREAAQIEDRLETVDGQLEVFEHVYEMCSQRIGEFRDAKHGHTLEWVIIVLLAAETLIMLIDMLWNLQE
jgi:hypothetical protein